MTFSHRRELGVQATTASLLFVGALRIFGLVLHRPLYGYANNFDFYRLAQWYGITADRSRVLEAHPQSPLSRYFLDGPRVPENAYVSSDLPFLDTAVRLQRLVNGDGSLDLHWVGLVRAMALVVAGVGVCALLHRRSRGAALVWSAVFALVLADPLVTMFANTLYCEFSAVLFAALAAGTLLVLHGRETWGVAVPALGVMALTGLGLSKQQHQALPLVLVILSAVVWMLSGTLTRSRRWGLSALLAAALAVLAVQSRPPARGTLGDAIRMANATDAWFGAVLPELSNPPRAIRSLGLPGKCARYVGRIWYDRGMQPPPCPQIAEVSRAKALLLLAREPLAAARLLEKAARRSRPWILEGYGGVEGKPGGKLSSEEGPFAITVASVTDAASFPLYGACLLFAMALGPLGILGAGLARLRMGTFVASRTLLAAVVLSGIVTYGFGVALLGDGFVCLDQHVHLGAVALLPCLGALALLLSESTTAIRARLAREDVRERTAVDSGH